MNEKAPEETKEHVAVEPGDVDDTTPLTVDEVRDVGKEALARLRDGPLKYIRRGARSTLDVIDGAVDGAVEAFARRKKPDKGDD